MKVEESLLIEDAKEEESTVYIKLKPEAKETLNEYKQPETTSFIETKEAKILKDIFDPIEEQNSNSNISSNKPNQLRSLRKKLSKD